MSRCGMLSEFAVASAYTMYQIKSIAFFANYMLENIGHMWIHKSHLCGYEIIRIRNLMHIGKIVIECNCLELE